MIARSPWLERADWLEQCDLEGICPDCGDPVVDCDGHDLDDDTDFEPLET